MRMHAPTLGSGCNWKGMSTLLQHPTLLRWLNRAQHRACKGWYLGTPGSFFSGALGPQVGRAKLISLFLFSLPTRLPPGLLPLFPQASTKERQWCRVVSSSPPAPDTAPLSPCWTQGSVPVTSASGTACSGLHTSIPDEYEDAPEEAKRQD